MDSERLETVIIGGGQASLATGYNLAKRDLPFVILDATHGSATPSVNGGIRYACLPLPAIRDCLAGPFQHPARRTRRRRMWPTISRPTRPDSTYLFEPALRWTDYSGRGTGTFSYPATAGSRPRTW